MKDGNEKYISNPQDFPDTYKQCFQPTVKANIIVPSQYYAAIMEICKNVDGEQESIDQIDEKTTHFVYILPLSEIIIDFYDNLKKTTAGMARL